MIDPKRAVETLERILYITIASVSEDSRPWNSPVYSAFDSNLNFFWASDKNAQHSSNVRANREVFLVIYDSTVAEGTGEGVYIQAEVRELNEKGEILSALKVLDSRVGKTKQRGYGDFSGEAVLRVYQAIPRKIWMNSDDQDTDGNYIRNIRIELQVDDIIKAMGLKV
jgi:uncharacterized protein YhbP (UPF0306 family)